ESDEVVILLRRITILRHLYHVESELSLQVRGMILRVPDGISVFGAQLRVLDGNGLVDSRVARDIRSIVRERAQRKGVLVGILALQQQFSHEVTAAHVVHQIAKFHAAKRVIAEILDNGTAIGVAVCLLELVFRERRKSLEKERAELIGPKQIDDSLMRENAVPKRAAATHQHEQKDRRDARAPQEPSAGSGALRKS